MPSSPGFRPTHATHANAKAATRKMRMASHFAVAAKPSQAGINKYANSLEESLNRVRKMKSSYSMHAATKAAAKATANAAVKAVVHTTMKIQQKAPTIGYRTHMSAANITRRVSPKVEKAVETIMDRLVKKLDVGKKHHGGARHQGGALTMRNRSKRNKTRKLY